GQDHRPVPPNQRLERQLARRAGQREIPFQQLAIAQPGHRPVAIERIEPAEGLAVQSSCHAIKSPFSPRTIPHNEGESRRPVPPFPGDRSPRLVRVPAPVHWPTTDLLSPFLTFRTLLNGTLKGESGEGQPRAIRTDPNKHGGDWRCRSWR